MNLSEALVTGGEEGGCCLCGLNAWTLDMGSADSFVLQFANNKPWPWSYSYSIPPPRLAHLLSSSQPGFGLIEDGAVGFQKMSAPSGVHPPNCMTAVVFVLL